MSESGSSLSWYLDPLVAAQKRSEHQKLIRDWAGESFSGHVLKTDLFEEAYGSDRILFDLFASASRVTGIDIEFSTVQKAMVNCPLPSARFLTTDLRQFAIQSASVDLIVSNSTLDHFETRAEFEAAVAQIAGVLRPGGLLIITMDNPWNPLYHLLRWSCRLRRWPFALGYTTSAPQLRQSLERAGLRVEATAELIHNPRLVSTVLFLALRKLLGRYADAPVRLLLALFALLGRLPTRSFTACFVAAAARRPAGRE